MSTDAIVVTHHRFDGRFTIVGWVGSEPVLATFGSRELRCSRVLFDKAEQLTLDLVLTGADGRRQPDRIFGAESLAVLFSTLLSLFDRVSAADISTVPSKGTCRQPAATLPHLSSRGALHSPTSSH